jgi:hypothetical protein
MNRHETPANEPESVTLGRLAHIIRAYRVPILLALAVVICGYLVIASVILVTSPTLTVTSLPFRLTFSGAESGKYPNGTEFSPTEIVAQPILARVWEANRLEQYLPLGVFVRSVYVIEANPEMEQLVREYQARLSDPKLSPIDRDRLVREFDTRKQSIAKNEYTLNFSAAREADRLPDTLVKKVLNDILTEWAEYATREQRVLQYGIAVLSPNVVPPTGDASMDYISRLQVLRANTYRAMTNLYQIEELPGGKMARTRGDNLTLQDIRTRLEDMVRFRLEPLVPAIRASGLIPNVAEAIRFSQMQLAYDERHLAYARDAAQVIRQAILTYSNVATAGMPDEALPAAEEAATAPVTRQPTAETVTPQLSETFLERLVQMSSAAADVRYRQDLIDEYRKMASAIPPVQQAVMYDREIIEHLRSAPTGAPSVTAAQVEQQIRAMQTEVHEALEKMNELYASISGNLSPGTHMYNVTSVTTTRTERRIDPIKLAALGILIFFLALPMIIAGVLIHSRIRQEDTVEETEGVAVEA